MHRSCWQGWNISSSGGQLALAKHFQDIVGLLLRELQLDPGVGFADGWDHVWQKVRRKGREYAGPLHG